MYNTTNNIENNNIEKIAITNGARIRCMSNEELAWLLLEFRFDAFCKATGGEAILPDSQTAICEWLNKLA